MKLSRDVIKKRLAVATPSSISFQVGLPLRVRRYVQHQGLHVSRAQFEANLFEKMRDEAFHDDMQPLLVPGALQTGAFDSTAFQTSEVQYDAGAAYHTIKKELIERLPGEPWKGGK